MKPMTYKELGEKVAEQALDDYLINGKTMREWINILFDNMSVLDKIRAEIIKQFEGCYLEEDMTDERKAEHKAYKNVLQIIDKYKGDKE